MLVWLGSALAVIALALLSIFQLCGLNRWLAISCSAVYLLGVQLPTVTINIPLNNQLQSLDLDAMSEAEMRDATGQHDSPVLPEWEEGLVASFTTK